MKSYLKRVNRNEYIILQASYIILFICACALLYVISLGGENETVVINKEVVVEKVVKIPVKYREYRLTSYYIGDSTGSGTCTASGICTDKFTINNKGWYLYKGMLVLASGYEYKLKDIITLVIDDVEYKGIILDKCGACRKDTRLDLFVSDGKYAIDRGYKGINPIMVEMGE